MKINKNYKGIQLSYARISRIDIDNDFIKTITDNKGNKTTITGRILVNIKLYPSEESYKKYGNQSPVPTLEDIPIEGNNFIMCNQEIRIIEKVIEAILSGYIQNITKG
ncbi:MAG: hypothetical protein ACM31M_07330 [Nitrososphaerota archaeon]